MKNEGILYSSHPFLIVCGAKRQPIRFGSRLPLGFRQILTSVLPVQGVLDMQQLVGAAFEQLVIDIAEGRGSSRCRRSGTMLTLCDIRVRFGAKQVLAGGSLQLEKGQRIALMGPSGCGKTTLARVALSLQVPVSGTVSCAFGRVSAVF